jgi:DNA-binding Xre family transcriptional regulator
MAQVFFGLSKKSQGNKSLATGSLKLGITLATVSELLTRKGKGSISLSKLNVLCFEAKFI